MQQSELFETLSAGLEELESEILLVEEDPGDAERMGRIVQGLGLDSMEWGGATAKELVSGLAQGRIKPDQQTVDALLGLAEALKRVYYQTALCLEGRCGDDNVTALDPLPETAQEQPKAEEAPEAAAPQEPKAAETAAPEPSQASAPKAREGGGREQAFIKVNTRKLDELMESVQELVISSTMMGQTMQRAAAASRNGDATSANDMLEHDRCIESIRKHVLDIRKMNLRSTCTRMSRLVRETAGGIGKEAELRCSGEDVEVDKSVLDDLGDPLIHLLRNAVDHGVELPEEREAKGKPRIGSIRLDAAQEGKELVLRITDDGRGLNRERILAKAKERGLVQPDRMLSDFSEKELFGLIMQPGFSTAEKVSNVSGRGVGMDVVAQSLRAMQGELEIGSKEGQGSSFVIRVPSDRASLEGITQGVLVELGGQHFVLRSGCVREVFRPAGGSVHTLGQEGEVVASREGTLPFYRLHCMLEIDPRHEEPEDGLVVVVEAGKEKLALQVDDVLGERQVVVRTFAAMDVFLGETLFSGVAFIGNMTAMILDADRFLQQAKRGNEYLGCRFDVCSGEELR